jgi:tripartite motif-containing protein 71
MGERRIWAACLTLSALLFVVSVAAPGAEEERAPSLEFAPAPDFVPQEREVLRAQPLILFTNSVGRFGINTGSFDGPVDVAHDSEGNYYVLDGGNSRVQKFTRRDRFVLQWGTFGATEGRFDKPRAIVVDEEGFVYVVDAGNHRIQKFDSEGEFLASFGSLGAAPGKFNSPTDIAFDDKGNLFVLDVGNDRVQEFNPNGIFIDQWGRFTGGRQGDFSNLVSIAWFRERFGFLFLLGAGVEEGTCQVQMLRLKGGRREVVNSWELTYPEDEECLAIRMEIDNRDDYVYILDNKNNALRRYTADGRYLDSVWEADQPFNGPMGFSIREESREVWVADTANNIIQRFSLR